MAVQYSTVVRMAMLDAIESGAQAGQTTSIGSGPKMLFYTGANPATCADVHSGNIVATLTLTGDFMSNASTAGNVVTKAKNGASSWSATASLAGTNTIASYRIYDSTETTCHEQGTVTTTAVGTGDITLDNTSVAQGQTITITGKTITAGNA